MRRRHFAARSAARVVAAESDKLRTLPAAVLTAVGTVVAGAVLAAVLAANAVRQDQPVSVVTAVLQSVPYVQAGLILLGVLPAAHEYAGRQVLTTLTAVPDRVLLLTGKTLAAAVACALTASAALGAGTIAAAVTRHLLDAPVPEHRTQSWALAGAVAHLVLLGLLAHAVAVLTRAMVPSLAGMLVLVLVLSPLSARFTEHARWLPDRAGMRLYDSGDPVLTAATGGLVLLGWIGATGALAALRFVRRDP